MVLSDEMPAKAERVAEFLKGFANPHRLLVLCSLIEGEKSVSELIDATGIPQTSMSQHLAKLKDEGIVSYRREHRTLFYSIGHPATRDLMHLLYNSFCKDAP